MSIPSSVVPCDLRRSPRTAIFFLDPEWFGMWGRIIENAWVFDGNPDYPRSYISMGNLRKIEDEITCEITLLQIVVNFIRSFLRANVKPHVLFLTPSKGEVHESGFQHPVPFDPSFKFWGGFRLSYPWLSVIISGNYGSTLNAYGIFKERVENLRSSEWKNDTSMQSRIIFGEVMKALNVHHFFEVSVDLWVAACLINFFDSIRFL